MELTAGREMDRAVCELFEPEPEEPHIQATNVAFVSEGGWWVWPNCLEGWQPQPVSTDIAAAWLVVDALNDGNFELIDTWGAPAADRWQCRFGEQRGTGSTAPLAICRAALACRAALQETR